MYQGSPMSNILFGMPVQKVMSNIGMEVTTLGNHEFDWTLGKIINTTMINSNYSIVCSNLYRKNADGSKGQRVFDPYKIIDKDGVKIAVVGAITEETPTTSLPAHVQDYVFTDIASEVNAVVKDIRDNNKADVVIAVMHEGSDATCKSGKIFNIANSLKGVDAVFGGHSHTAVASTAADGKTPVVIANSFGKGYIDLKMSIDSSKHVSFVNTLNSYIPINTTAANGYKAKNPVTDSQVMSIVADAKSQIGSTFNEVIGTTPIAVTKTSRRAIWRIIFG